MEFHLKSNMGPEQMAQWLKAHNALLENLSVDLSTPIRAAPNCLEVQV